MSRRAVVLSSLLLLAPLAAACQPATAAPQSAATSPSATEQTTRPAPQPKIKPLKIKPPTTKPPKISPPKIGPPKTKSTPEPLFGRQYAYLKSADLAHRRLTFDLIEWFSDRAAVKACKQDGQKPAENDWCTGWYIRNDNPRLRTLTVDPDARLRAFNDHHDLVRTDLGKLVAGLRQSNHLFRFDVDANRIMTAEQVYTP